MDSDLDLRNLGEYDNIYFKTASATGSGFVLGNVAGALIATWKDVPAVERNQALPALKKTARVMGSYGVTFAAIGGVFAAAEATSEALRGKKDFINGAVGGIAAGTILGLRAGSVGVGVAACAAMAAAAVLSDVTNSSVTSPLERDYLPYPTVNPNTDS
eukprot:TRINITY_DN14995_c0_g1_i1.p1 TRINITY_DN14995_c0_g1~~TRINITY_DN14995_c0_g1_i1.p1  ORF type:complete len:159 (-),score=41.19 TRINITY_DN14995_c0_g1_i1:468-944(-)